MIIAIDLDDVLADSLTAFIKFYNETHQDVLKHEDFTSYLLTDIRGISREEEYKLLKEFENSPHSKELKPMPKSQEAIKQLSKGNELVIVTSRLEEVRELTMLWLKKYFPELTRVYFTRIDYGKVRKSKAEICKEIQADILIEDNLKYAKEVAEAGIKVLLYDYPWNQTPETENIQRVKDWDEILSVLN